MMEWIIVVLAVLFVSLVAGLAVRLLANAQKEMDEIA